MYRITKTIFICKNGKRECSDKVVDVDDLEGYRRSIRTSRHARINFVYQTIPEDEYNGENQADQAPEGTEEPCDKG